MYEIIESYSNRGADSKQYFDFLFSLLNTMPIADSQQEALETAESESGINQRQARDFMEYLMSDEVVSHGINIRSAFGPIIKFLESDLVRVDGAMNAAGDKAMFNNSVQQKLRGSVFSAHNLDNKTGGIDLTPANKVLQTQNSGIGIKFHLDPAQLAQLQNAQGFTIGSITIQPLKSLQEFLGINVPA